MKYVDPSPQFYDICRQIEKDANYGSNMSEVSLRDMMATHYSYTTARTAILASLETTSPDLGRLFNVSRVSYGGTDDRLLTLSHAWNTTSYQVLVCYNGDVRFYNKDDRALKSPLHNFSEAHKTFDLNQFLGLPCLRPKTDGKTVFQSI